MRRICGAVPATLMLTASALALSLAAIVPTMAQTWDGSESTDWRDANNWSGGVVPSVPGTVTLTGPVANLPTISGGSVTIDDAFLGAVGGTTLTLTNGAQLASDSVTVGENNTNNAGDLLELQSGQVNLSSGASWTTSTLNIGSYGKGVVDVSGSSTVTINTALNLGAHRSSTTGRFGLGKLLISGTGSQVVVNGSTNIGKSTITADTGDGEIRVENGGQFTTRATNIGTGPSSSGTVTVDGNGSKWTVASGSTVIGDAGKGELVISGGAAALFVSGTGQVDLAKGTGSSGALTVTGVGSQVTAGTVSAANLGSATVDVNGGALLKVTELRLAALNAAGTATATVSGVGTRLEASNAIRVGAIGNAALTISDGATVKGTVYVGLGTTSGGVVNIGAAAGSPAVAPGTIDANMVSLAANTARLVFNHTGSDFVFAPKLVGNTITPSINGTIRHLAGTTTLTGDSSAFGGATQIEGGLLRVANVLGGNVSVSSGGALGGNGTLSGTTQVNSGGIVAPDGTLTFTGNLNFGAGSTYRADVGNGTSDLITSNGTVTINGGAVNLQTAGKSFSREESYKILGGTVLSGTFDSLTTQSAFLDSLLDYSKTNEVWVNLSRNDVAFQSIAASGNQQAIGNILNALPLNHPLVAAMLGLSAEEARDAMNQLSGDTQATLETAGASIAGQVQNVLMNRIRQAFSAIGAQGSAISSYAPRLGEVDAGESPEISYWLQGLGEYTQVDATAKSGGLRSGTAGVLGGADVALGEWRLGVVGGYTGTGYTAQGRPANGSINNLHAGVYAGAELDAVSLQFNALQTWHGISSRRDVSFGGLNETLTADYGAQTSLLFGEVGYSFDLGAVELQPFGSVAYSLGHTNAYAESGGASALTVAASSQQSVTTVLGLRPEMAFAVDDKLLTVRGMLGWQHQAGEVPTGEYSLAGSTPFTVTGSSLANNAFVYEAGLNLDVNEGLNLDLLYSGRLAQNDFAQGIKGIVAAKF